MGTWFMGLDSSTQSLTAVVVDVDEGEIILEQSVNFGSDLPEYDSPQGFLAHPDPLVKHADPLLWAAALDRLLQVVRGAGIGLERIRGISGSGQQHGTVYLRPTFVSWSSWPGSSSLPEIIQPHLSRRTAPIWMDSSTSVECREIAQSAGDAERVRRASGSPPIERFSGPQIRKFYKGDPQAYSDTGVIHLVSSFMCSLLTGKSSGIDLGDGAGMNLLNLAEGDWDATLLAATAPELRRRLPAVAACDTCAGQVSAYFVEKYGFREGTPVVTWSGDNPNSLIGVGGWRPGTVVVSLGTSDTLFAAMSQPTVDPDGYGHVFGNPAGGFMSLICFKNGALARDAVRDRFGLDWDGFEQCLGQSTPGNNGNMMLPYFVPEITPAVLHAGPRYLGSQAFLSGADSPAVVRAVVEAQAIRLRLYSTWIGAAPDTIRVTGGAAANTAICQVLADAFGARVERLDTGNSAALGAAMRAANAVTRIGWEQLTQAFCASPRELDVAPVAGNVAAYRAMIPRYADFAAQSR